MAVMAALIWAAGVAAQAALSPVALRCEQRVNPQGIGSAIPRLSWQLQSDGQGRGEVQSAYQIQVGSTAADLWDSGPVASTTVLALSTTHSDAQRSTTLSLPPESCARSIVQTSGL